MRTCTTARSSAAPSSCPDGDGDTHTPPRARRARTRETADQLSTTHGPAELFTGEVYVDVVAHGQAPSRIRVNTVRFGPGARTAWHSHSLGQTLHVTDGLGIVATHEEVIIMRPGDTVHPRPARSTGTARCPTTS